MKTRPATTRRIPITATAKAFRKSVPAAGGREVNKSAWVFRQALVKLFSLAGLGGGINCWALKWWAKCGVWLGMCVKKDRISGLFVCKVQYKLTFEHIAVFLVEFVHTAGGIDDFLFAGVERMAFGANLDIEGFFGHGGFGIELVAARAGNRYVVVIWVDTLFHDHFLLVSGHRGCAYASG